MRAGIRQSSKPSSRAHARSAGRGSTLDRQRLQMQEQHRGRVRDLVWRMSSGETIAAKDYVAETGCSLSEAKNALTKAMAHLAFIRDNEAYIDKLNAAGDEALEAARGRPDSTAKLIDSMGKLRGYIPSSGAHIDIQVGVMLAERAPNLMRLLGEVVGVGARSRFVSRFVALGQTEEAAASMADVLVQDVMEALVERAGDVAAELKGEERRLALPGGRSGG